MARFILPIVFLLALCIPCSAKWPKTKPRTVAHHHTIIESVTSGSITVQTTGEKDAATQTYKILPTTEITFNGQTVTADQLQAGQRVDVTPDGADDSVAGQITASDPPPADPTPAPKHPKKN